MKSLMGKLFLFSAALVILSLLILGGGMFPQMRGYAIAEKKFTLRRTAEQVGSMTTELLGNYSYIQEKNYQFLLNNMTDGGIQHILICAADGQIILSSDDSKTVYTGRYVDQTVRDTILKEGKYEGSSALKELYPSETYTSGVTYTDGVGAVSGFVLVTTSIEQVNRLVGQIQSIFSLWMLLVIGITAIMSFFISRTLTRPIKRVSKAAKEFAHGNYHARVPVTSVDEIGELTVAFNNMADSIEKAEELRRSFVANVSHELRSPMTSIAGFVDGIADGTIPPEQQQHYLNIISSEVRRLSRLVSRMLDITRMQAEDALANGVRFNLCEVIRRVIIAFEARLTERGLTLAVELPEQDAFVFGNEDALYQVVYNLTDNAVKFAEPGSVIRLRLRETSGKLWFGIENRGAEIPPEELPYVFDRFHKTDRSRAGDASGLGLGLYIVKTIVNQHGGDVGARSTAGETEFSVTLPASRGK